MDGQRVGGGGGEPEQCGHGGAAEKATNGPATDRRATGEAVTNALETIAATSGKAATRRRSP